MHVSARYSVGGGVMQNCPLVWCVVNRRSGQTHLCLSLSWPLTPLTKTLQSKRLLLSLEKPEHWSDITCFLKNVYLRAIKMIGVGTSTYLWFCWLVDFPWKTCVRLNVEDEMWIAPVREDWARTSLTASSVSPLEVRRDVQCHLHHRCLNVPLSFPLSFLPPHHSLLHTPP